MREVQLRILKLSNRNGAKENQYSSVSLKI